MNNYAKPPYLVKEKNTRPNDIMNFGFFKKRHQATSSQIIVNGTASDRKALLQKMRDRMSKTSIVVKHGRCI
jgi:NADH:ubiquinone oxidoreductase subunit B-like Fe-S oxidoreductase